MAILRNKSVLALSLVLFIIIGSIILTLTIQGFRPNIGPLGLKYYDRGPLYPASLKTALTDCQVRDELLAQDLVCLDTGKDEAISVRVNSSDIEGLIKSGTYYIGGTNILQPVPVSGDLVRPPTQDTYKYAQRLTRAWGNFDDYRYTAHSVYVTIPTSVNLTIDGNTTHNLYNTHLVQPDGKWVETGVGWVNWASSPIIYTYESFTDTWTFKTIPSDVQRDIFLSIEISDGVAEMSVSDLYSGMSVSSRRTVSDSKFRVDLTQEQHSFDNSWVETSESRFHANRIKKLGNEAWVDWDSSIQSSWISESPLYARKGYDDEQIWTDTWSEAAN